MILMKTNRIAVALAACACVTGALAAPAHAHENAAQTAKKAGPNGGRVITKVTPNVEFLVQPDRRVKLTFLDAEGKPVAAGQAMATLTGGDRLNPSKLTFVKDGDALVSQQSLPAGEIVPVVLQLRMTPEGEVVMQKFNVNFAICPECKHTEYACTCGH